MVATGISYVAQTKDEVEEFNSLPCIDMHNFHWAPSLTMAIKAWNIRVQDYLKYHINLRLVDRTLPRGSRQIMPFAATFGLSLFFHGWYHGFFAFFVGLGLNEAAQKAFASTKLAKALSKPFSPFILPVITTSRTQVTLRLLCVPFLVLTLKDSIIWYNHTLWASWIPATVTIIVCMVLPKAKRDKPAVPKTAVAAQSTQET
jgi:hypothetical protein